MFIAHANGHPIVIKTNIGGRFIGFASFADGESFLRSKQTPCSLGTPDEIVRLNPNAFSRDCSVFLLPTREAIQKFVADPKDFATGEFLVTLKTE
jgi:hypothetical protein